MSNCCFQFKYFKTKIGNFKMNIHVIWAQFEKLLSVSLKINNFQNKTETKSSRSLWLYSWSEIEASLSNMKSYDNFKSSLPQRNSWNWYRKGSMEKIWSFDGVIALKKFLSMHWALNLRLHYWAGVWIEIVFQPILKFSKNNFLLRVFNQLTLFKDCWQK